MAQRVARTKLDILGLVGRTVGRGETRKWVADAVHSAVSKIKETLKKGRRDRDSFGMPRDTRYRVRRTRPQYRTT